VPSVGVMPPKAWGQIAKRWGRPTQIRVGYALRLGKITQRWGRPTQSLG